MSFRILRRILIFLLSFLIFVIFSPNKVFADGEFLIDTDVEYYLQDDGVTRVTHNITLENVLPTIYAKSYTLKLQNIDAQNVKAYEQNENLDTYLSKEGDLLNIQINFPDSLVGKGVKRKFSVVFDVNDFAVRTGEVWEISIPKLEQPENYRDYSVVISIPSKLGNEAYISPEPLSRQNVTGRTNYIFNKDMVSTSGISAGFGEFQIFSFSLNYHLENPLNQKAETEIALPPDTEFQKMYYTSLSPKPETVRIDTDGNWLALYSLKSRERLDIKADGFVQIYSSERQLVIPNQEILNQNLLPSAFWQTEDKKIIDLANKLKTPRNIYDYVVNTLSYDYERVKPNEQRLGALEALQNPNSAICMEFTDLFIAISRAAGIPAREIDGYAYTENPEIQPLSLVSDVLHSWPEYWDSQRKVWVQVDPTWGSTTGGIDYFSKLDLRHFTFVIHGSDAEKPYAPGSYKLGPNPQKDVYVNFAKLPELKPTDVNITANTTKSIPFISVSFDVNIENPGPLALYNIKPTVYFDGIQYLNQEITVLPPYSSYDFSFKVPFSFLGTKTPEKITIETKGKTIDIPGYKSSVIISSLAFLFIIFLILLIVIIVKFKKQTFLKIITKIYELKSKQLFKKKE